mmetsp:Transcript_281/g.705  ORF Transcript_281/g.705 Transcript_281/m.705 type:complete len:1102 (-) Transcript_281:421-3726(-)
MVERFVEKIVMRVGTSKCVPRGGRGALRDDQKRRERLHRNVNALQVAVMVAVVAPLHLYLSGGCCGSAEPSRAGRFACLTPILTSIAALRLAPEHTVGGKLRGAATAFSATMFAALSAGVVLTLALLVGAPRSGMCIVDSSDLRRVQAALTVLAPAGCAPLLALRAFGSVAPTTKVWGVLSSSFYGSALLIGLRLQILLCVERLASTNFDRCGYFSSLDTIWLQIAAPLTLSGAIAALAVSCTALMLCPQMSLARVASELRFFTFRAIASRLSRLLSVSLNTGNEVPEHRVPMGTARAPLFPLRIPLRSVHDPATASSLSVRSEMLGLFETTAGGSVVLDTASAAHGANEHSAVNLDVEENQDELDAGWIGAIPEQLATTRALAWKPVWLPLRSDGRSQLLKATEYIKLLAWEPAAVPANAHRALLDLVESLHVLLLVQEGLALVIDGVRGRRFSAYTLHQLFADDVLDSICKFAGAMVVQSVQMHALMDLSPPNDLNAHTGRSLPLLSSEQMARAHDEAIAHVRKALTEYLERLQGTSSWSSVAAAGELRALLFTHSVLHDIFRAMLSVGAALERYKALLTVQQEAECAHGWRKRMIYWKRRSICRLSCLPRLLSRLLAVDIIRAALIAVKSARNETGDVLDKRYFAKLWTTAAIALIPLVWLAPVLTNYSFHWVYVSAVIVLQVRFEATVVSSANRFVGTVLGGVLGALVMSIRSFATSLVALCACTSVIMYSVTYAYEVVTPSRQYGIYLFFITYAVVAFCQYDGASTGSVLFALQRTVSVLLGVSIAIVVDRMVWPSSSRVHLLETLRKAISAEIQWLGSVLSVYQNISRVASARARGFYSPEQIEATTQLEYRDAVDAHGELNVEILRSAFKKSGLATRDSIRGLLDSAQTVLAAEYFVVPRDELQITAASYQLLVALHATSSVMKHPPELAGEYIGADYEVYVQPMRASIAAVLEHAHRVLDHIEEILRIKAELAAPVMLPRLLCHFAEYRRVLREQLDAERWALRQSLSVLDVCRARARRDFLAIRRQRIMSSSAAVNHADSAARLYLPPDDTVRFYGFFFCWTVALNKFTLVGNTVLEPVVSQGELSAASQSV